MQRGGGGNRWTEESDKQARRAIVYSYISCIGLSTDLLCRAGLRLTEFPNYLVSYRG